MYGVCSINLCVMKVHMSLTGTIDTNTLSTYVGTDINSGWCNVPHKSRFGATEMMTVAYHNKRVVYAYHGFNRNIDSDWTGGILLDHHKCVDHCTKSGNIGERPAPSDYDNRGNRLLAIAFDKYSPDNWY